MKQKEVICWGDSITIGMGMKRNEAYPALLGDFLGKNYKVINAGSSGEMSNTIAARQGAVKVYSSKDFVFKKGDYKIDIGRDNNHGMCLEDGTMLDINKDGEAFSLNDLHSDVLFINNVEYTFSVKDDVFYLERANSDSDLIIKKGTKIVFASAKKRENSYCQIFLMGANDGLIPTDEEINKLISWHKSMIAYYKSECYIVIIPFWDNRYIEPFKNAFGERAINILEALGDSKISSDFLWQNNPEEIHLNQKGYSFLAETIYKKGIKLGFWN